MEQGINFRGLHAPFNAKDVEFRPGATTKDKTKAIGLAYVDKRIYEDRLDNIVGTENWSVEYRHLGENAIICRLTIAGVVREDVGEFSKDDVSSFPTAVAQAFKRACSSFGLGRYLYSLPQVWAEYDAERRAFTQAGMAHLRKTSFIQVNEQKQEENNKPNSSAAETKSISAEKLIARIEELLLKAEASDAEVQMPKNWKSLSVEELTKLGKQLSIALQG
jgi:hypothetical protein